MKGVGAEHQVLMSATSICECEHSHLYVSLISARHGRATPFKKRKRLQIFGVEKSRAEKSRPDPRRIQLFINNLRILTLMTV